MMKIATIVFVLLTVIVNIFALTGLFYDFGVASTDWQAPFSTMGDMYTGLVGQVFNAANGLSEEHFNFTLPAWGDDALVAYIASAAAIAASGLGITSREGFVDGVKSSGLSVAWPIGIVFLMWKAVRMQLVTKFVRDHGKIFLGYIIVVLGGYLGATYINANMLM